MKYLLCATLFVAAAWGRTLTGLDFGTDGLEGNQAATDPAISFDGRFVVFDSRATNLVNGDTNGLRDIFVVDVDGNDIDLVSRADGNNGQIADANCFRPDISDNGNAVVFESSATNLASAATGVNTQVFLRSLDDDNTILISRASGINGAQGNGNSGDAAINGNGRLVVFDSSAANLGGGTAAQIVMRNTDDDTTSIVSRANGINGAVANAACDRPAISSNGRFIGFTTTATNLVTAGAGNDDNVYLRDTNDDTTILVSVAQTGGSNDGDSTAAPIGISANGRYVCFQTTAALAVADTNGRVDVYVRDTDLGVTVRASRSILMSGDGDGDSLLCDISGNGRYVVFTSTSTNMVGDDNNGVNDVFLRDLDAGITTRISVDLNGFEANAASQRPTISEDGSLIAFDSLATQLAPNFDDGNNHIYLAVNIGDGGDSYFGF